MAKDFSPEERLLRLIKGKQKSAFAPEELIMPEGEEKKDIPEKDEREEAKKEKTSLIPSPPKGERVGPVRKIFSNGVRVRGPKFPYLYIISGIVLLSLIGVFVFKIFFDREKEELQDLERMIAALSEEAAAETPPAEGAKPPPQETKPEVKDSFEEYQKLLIQKSIFAPPVKERVKSRVPEGPALRELIAGLRLVGIVPGDEPQAIIEDKKNSQTLFLKKGEQIEGIEIREIQNGRVVLGYGEETVTLSL